MDRQDYNKAINKNTMECWGIILAVLFISYFVEVLRGLRTIPYFITFMILLAVPYIAGIIFNKKHEWSDLNFKYLFVLGYMILYTFVLFTTKTYVTYVYVIPMVSILIAYCDSRLTLGMFIYVFIINVISVVFQYYDFVSKGAITFLLKDRITMWEIQLALVTLSGVFLYKACNILKKQNEILDSLSDDVYRDALTGIYNKKFLEKEIIKKFNEKGTKSIAFIDIDDFKKFNTLYGHSFGDEVLITICGLLEKEISKYPNTYLIRVGGDEFIIFSLDFTKKNLKTLLNQIVKKVASKQIPFGNRNVGIKISIGMAATDLDNCKKFVDLYNLADNRNGKAKKNGKNYVEDK